MMEINETTIFCWLVMDMSSHVRKIIQNIVNLQMQCEN